MNKRAFHIIFCIDLNSKNIQHLNYVKNQVVNIFSVLHSTAIKYEVELIEVKTKIIIYGNQSNQIKESRWYNISDKKGLSNEYFNAFVRNIQIRESDEESLGLEALSRAINSDWPAVTERNTKQVVFLHSDSASNVIDEKRFHEVTDSWMCSHGSSKLHQWNKRLVLFTPEEYPWPNIYSSWDKVCFFPLEKDKDVEYFIIEYEDVIRPFFYNSGL